MERLGGTGWRKRGRRPKKTIKYQAIGLSGQKLSKGPVTKDKGKIEPLGAEYLKPDSLGGNRGNYIKGGKKEIGKGPLLWDTRTTSVQGQWH